MDRVARRIHQLQILTGLALVGMPAMSELLTYLFLNNLSELITHYVGITPKYDDHLSNELVEIQTSH